MTTALAVLLWIIGFVLFTSFIEHQVHKHLMHTSHTFGAHIKALQRTFRHHAIEHHGQYRKQFTDEPVPPGTDRGLRLSLKEGFGEGLLFALVIVPFSILGAAVFPWVICGHHYIWNQIHLEMHKPEQRYFANWRLYKLLARHHYLHHRYPGKNFNVVLPIADYVLGTAAKAAPEDMKQMRALGLG